MSLHNAANQSQYVAECLLLVPTIDSLDQGGMQRGLVDAVNTQLRNAGVPVVTHGENPASQANAEFDFTQWRITFGAPLMVPGSLAALTLGVNTVYHEARHCEQWFRMAQGVAAGKLNKQVQQRITHTSAADIAAKLWIPLNIAQAAMANTSYGGNSESDVLAWWNSIYARDGGIRGRKLGHIQARYDDYRNLPEERDAWRLGGDVEVEFKDKCPAIGCPSYRYWKDHTKLWYASRSTELKAVDSALDNYEKSRSASDRKKLKVAFDAWWAKKEAKGGTARSADTVGQLKAFVDSFNDDGAPVGAIEVGGGSAVRNELAAALAKRAKA